MTSGGDPTGRGSAALPPPLTPTTGTLAANPDPPAADEVSEDVDSTSGEEGDEPTEAPDSDPGPGTPTNPPAPVVKARLVIEAESPLECTEGQQVELSCRVTTPTGISVSGVGVIFHVTDSAGGRDLGTARTGSDGVARRLYRPSFNSRGRRSSAALK